MFLDALKWLCKKWMFFGPEMSLLCDLPCNHNPKGTVNPRKAKTRCSGDVCVPACDWVHSLTSSLRSDPGLCLYHWIWACWDLGIHSRNEELLCTPNRTLSSTRPLTRPKEDISYWSKSLIAFRVFSSSLVHLSVWWMCVYSFAATVFKTVK